MAKGHAHHKAKAAVKHSKKHAHAKSVPCIPCQAKKNAALDDCTQKAIQAAPPDLCDSANKNIPIIMAECKKQGITDTNQIAYVLATAEHESRLGQSMDEKASGVDYEGTIGNTNAEDAKKYKGRGFVQLTGKGNYETWKKKTGQDLVTHPEKANDPQIAAEILVSGMKNGSFRHQNKLDDYIDKNGVDFKNARDIINADKNYPIDQNHPKTSPKRGDHVADRAQKYAEALHGCNSNPPDKNPPDKSGEPAKGQAGEAVKSSPASAPSAELIADPGTEFERNRLATQFYQENGKSPAQIMSHREGIDKTKPVSVKMLQPGDKIVRWEFPDEVLEIGKGSAYASYPGEDPEKMGIVTSRPNKTIHKVSGDSETLWQEDILPAKDAQFIKRVPVTYIVTQPTAVLESTAAKLPILNGATFGGEGGARQIWIPNTSGLVKQ